MVLSQRQGLGAGLPRRRLVAPHSRRHHRLQGQYEETPAPLPSPSALIAQRVCTAAELWIIGGTEDYYFGDASNLKSDCWCSSDGVTWECTTESAGWAPRGYLRAVTLGDRMCKSAQLPFAPSLTGGVRD